MSVINLPGVIKLPGVNEWRCHTRSDCNVRGIPHQSVIALFRRTPAFYQSDTRVGQGEYMSLPFSSALFFAHRSRSSCKMTSLLAFWRKRRLNLTPSIKRPHAQASQPTAALPKVIGGSNPKGNRHACVLFLAICQQHMDFRRKYGGFHYRRLTSRQY